MRFGVLAFSIAALACSGCAALRDQVQVDWVTEDGRNTFYCGLDGKNERNKWNEYCATNDRQLKTETSNKETGTPHKGTDTSNKESPADLYNRDDFQLRSTRQWIEMATHGEGQCESPEACRNTAQSRLLILSNNQCDRHLAGIHGYQSTWNLALKGLSTGLAGLASVVSADAAPNYAAGAAFAGTMQTAINSEVYVNMLATAVVAKITKMREQAREEISNKRSLSAKDYSPADAIEDALRYHSLCSFYAGMQALVEESGKRERSDIESNAASSLISVKDNLQRTLAAQKTFLGEIEKLIRAQKGNKDALDSLCRAHKQQLSAIGDTSSSLVQIELSLAQSRQFIRTAPPASPPATPPASATPTASATPPAPATPTAPVAPAPEPIESICR